MASGSNWIGSARLQHLRATGAVEKAVAPRPWETRRVSHFPTASTAGRTLPFDRSFGNIFDEATGWFPVTFLNEAIRPGILIVADHSTSAVHNPHRPLRNVAFGPDFDGRGCVLNGVAATGRKWTLFEGARVRGRARRDCEYAPPGIHNRSSHPAFLLSASSSCDLVAPAQGADC